VGAALKTLGLSFNATAADIRRCGLSEQDVRSRVQRFVKQVRYQVVLLAAAAGCSRVQRFGRQTSKGALLGAGKRCRWLLATLRSASNADDDGGG
jgi:hypothetical protein